MMALPFVTFKFSSVSWAPEDIVMVLALLPPLMVIVCPAPSMVST